ncbi:DNA integrity scanning protein DisA nucleotide-binding domain protein [Fusibacter paucivorans]|uniref:DNA integrity scanning protein DisA nucleotide-binding domain protein n=1 Tax=Fusibacter paucivorans TaxID=76009 RepID=A0ABS5PQ15_9FIRM|nr:DNA integrity scanning protein DisA nucleotide-binding domain protein [Fusibacter paucivorans]MBS7526112.1 DNA integrity scanning protein DisA nucleotide-binding domain protein [Fusibacter paucivorans]
MLNAYQLTGAFEPYITQIFKNVDEELIPEMGAITFHIASNNLIMTYKDKAFTFKTDHEQLETLYEKKHELQAFIELMPDFDHEWHQIVITQFTLTRQNLIAFLLVFDRKMLSPYERLPVNSRTVNRSIIDAIIAETLSILNEGIRTLAEGEVFSPPSVVSLMRAAGKSLFTELLDAPQSAAPFESISKISSLSYEKTFSNGKILLASLDDLTRLTRNSAFERIVSFETAIPLHRLRHIRKILELSGDDIYLLSDGEYIYGTVRILDAVEASRYLNQLLTIEFSHYASWQLSYNLVRLFQVVHEELFIPKPKISYYKFSRTLRELYPEFNAKHTLQLYKLILEAFKQIKGTLIVLSKNARSEALRLKNQGFVIEPKPLSESDIQSITRIDGAILMDLDGVCHGIGVILDGIATEKGDPSRGARYNSAIRYVETVSHNTTYADVIVIVISEDGDADMITKHTLNTIS